MAVELKALKVYWACSLTGMHDLAMRQIIDGADALLSITSGPTKLEVTVTPVVLLHLPANARRPQVSKGKLGHSSHRCLSDLLFP